MGNKSKSKKRDVITLPGGMKLKTKWKRMRNVAGAQLPPTRTPGWSGLVAPSLSKFATGRKFEVRSVVAAVEVNRAEQPWQKRAKELAKRERRAPDARRLAREARVVGDLR